MRYIFSTRNFCITFVFVYYGILFSYSKQSSIINKIIITDSVVVSLNTHPIFSYQSFYYTDSVTFLSAFNQVNKSIYIYKIVDTFDLFSKFSIPESIAGKFDDIRELYFHTPDSIFVLLNDKILIFNYKGEVKSIIELSDKLLQYPYVVGDLYKSYPSYIYKGNLHIFQLNELGPQRFKFFKYPLECKIDLKDVQLKSNNVYYSPLLKKKIYGLVRNAVKISHDTLGIITFYNDPSLYVYNYNTFNIDTINCKSKFQSFDIKPLKKKFISDKEVQYKHYQYSPWYTTIYWDPYRELYYRFFLNGIEEKNQNGLYNTFSDRQLIMMIFDKDLSKLHEQIIGKFNEYGVGQLYISINGVFLLTKSKGLSIDKIMLHKLAFN